MAKSSGTRKNEKNSSERFIKRNDANLRINANAANCEYANNYIFAISGISIYSQISVTTVNFTNIRASYKPDSVPRPAARERRGGKMIIYLVP
ncbi:hypothetical protein KAU19_04690, partial [Candidatus Parcubacteria bacterium]|nr:hypothetical protein [Candidatus Parcubacteria bacterium]